MPLNYLVQIIVSGRKDQLSQLEFAKGAAAHIILKYEQFFKISYPLPKVGEFETHSSVLFTIRYIIFTWRF